MGNKFHLFSTVSDCLLPGRGLRLTSAFRARLLPSEKHLFLFIAQIALSGLYLVKSLWYGSYINHFTNPFTFNKNI
jgi:hypothetical protein